MSSPRQILSRIVNTPTPGLETLPLVVTVLLVPAAMVTFPVALNALLGVLLGATVVLEATEFEVGTYLKDMVLAVASRPTPGLDQFKYVPVVYPILLALGGICLPFPTNIAFWGLFALSWFVSNSLFEFDEEIPTNLTALVVAVLSTGLLGGLLLNPVELGARVGSNGVTNVLIAGLPILAVALALKPRDNERQEEFLNQPASRLAGRESSSPVFPTPPTFGNSDNLEQIDGWSNPVGGMGFQQQQRQGMMNGVGGPMMDDSMGMNGTPMGGFQPQGGPPMMNRPDLQPNGPPGMDRPMGRNGALGGDPRPMIMDREDRVDPGMRFQQDPRRRNGPMNDGGWDRRPANEIASNEGFLRDRGGDPSLYTNPNEIRNRRGAVNEMQANEGFLNGRGGNRF